ncbi:D-2-hydroxyacid dehydrogenase [Weissella cibaria]|uniref:NAD(P)-dependent oxidoreductase n=1 Tax=Weissella cibaria TaxID=137591 RepID=UPI0011975337|nr:NAD(P)-dependent oxidoreductase [Weissella cibaria]TVV25672.1 D-2-hydroxyacid dehydrogenase [Weissella cibaria]
MKILMTSVRDDEEAAIAAYTARTGVEIITSTAPLEDNLDQLAAVDGVIMQQRNRLADAIYAQLAEAGLKQISTRTAGYDVINVPLAHEHGLRVTNVPAYSPRSVAEHALMQILRLLRKSYEVDRRVANNDYRWGGLQAKEIHSATIGIIGVCRIGGALAKLLAALGATVLGYDVNPRDDLAGIVTYTTKADLLQRADVVSLHVDLNETSVGLIGAAEFALMQPTAGLVNASRGPVIDTAALISALETGELAGVALDTVSGEETVFNVDHQEDGLTSQPNIEKLHAMSNVMLTPHIAFFTNIAVQNMVDIALDDVQLILNGETSPHEIER